MALVLGKWSSDRGLSLVYTIHASEFIENLQDLSKKVLQKTAAYSYYISLYLWLALIFIKDRITIDTEQLLGTGILGMAIIFALCWILFNFRGIRNG